MSRSLTSLATFLVRQGAWKSSLRFLPAMPPTTVRGRATSRKSETMMAMVGAGSAAVELLCHATEFRKANTHVRGAGNTIAEEEATPRHTTKHTGETHSVVSPDKATRVQEAGCICCG